MPLLTGLAVAAALASAGAGIGGVVENGIAQGNVNKATSGDLALQQQELSQNAQTFGERQDLYNKLFGFYQPYTQSGSPFLAQQQRAGAEQNAQQFGNEAGQLRQQLGQSGMGYGPSGTTAAALGGLSNQQAQAASGNYLQNLLNNEAVKFQAAQGLQGAGSLIQPGQAQQVNPQQIGTNQPLASSLSALGPQLAQLLKDLPSTGDGSFGPGNGLPANFYDLIYGSGGVHTPLNPPSTEGYGFGDWSAGG